VAIALLLAAGLGERLGLSRPKALAELAGRPLWRWSADVLLAVPEIERVVLATPPDRAGEFGASAADGLIVVPGGAVRSESVRLALTAGAKGGVDSARKGGVDSASKGGADSLVLVHDAARPLLTPELVRETLAAASREGVDAAIAATPLTDTVKQADGGGRVLRTLDRAGLWAVQTPQAFKRGVLERALDVGADVLAQATDDAWLIERTGGCVVVVPAPRENLKVTTPLDLELAELLLARRAGRTAA
jgi:2-C-methyl-D-erythritol 4-phosphate cytidylyltransferase